MPFFKTPTIHGQLQSGLGRISAEIRHLIYIEVFTIQNTDYGTTTISFQHSHEKDVLTSSDPNVRYRWTAPDSVLAFIETCRLIYIEAEAYFYFLNNLEITRLRDRFGGDGPAHPDPTQEFWLWAPSLRMYRCYAIKTITVRIDSVEQGTEILRFLRCIPNLKEITLGIDEWTAAALSDWHQRWVCRRWGDMTPEMEEFWWEVGRLKWEHGINVRTEWMILVPGEDWLGLANFDRWVSAA